MKYLRNLLDTVSSDEEPLGDDDEEEPDDEEYNSNHDSSSEFESDIEDQNSSENH